MVFLLAIKLHCGNGHRGSELIESNLAISISLFHCQHFANFQFPISIFVRLHKSSFHSFLFFFLPSHSSRNVSNKFGQSYLSICWICVNFLEENIWRPSSFMKCTLRANQFQDIFPLNLPFCAASASLNWIFPSPFSSISLNSSSNRCSRPRKHLLPISTASIASSNVIPPSLFPSIIWNNLFVNSSSL